MPNVLITGITGFLGSHIAEVLLQNKVEVIGLKRIESDIWRCQEFKDRIDWVDIDECWKDKVLNKKPGVIIHCAWIGVEARFREDWLEQTKNITFLVELLELGKEIELQKFIFLGSQAEYGLTTGKISEEHLPSPVNAYGSVKLAALELLKTFASLNRINWLWLRVFSVFGEKENANWLIPSVIRKMQAETQMDLTAGEQQYAYLYVRDLSEIINRMVHKDISSGIYNISSNKIRTLKSLVEIIKKRINSSFNLNFGAVPYRKDQSMHIEGDISKIEGELGELEFTDFHKALDQTVQYYLKN